MNGYSLLTLSCIDLSSKTNIITRDFYRKKVVLEKVFGFTIISNVCVAQSCDGTLAYLAGCTVVIYSPRSKLQEFITSPAKKALTSVAFSTDGKLLATGEVYIFGNSFFKLSFN